MKQFEYKMFNMSEGNLPKNSPIGWFKALQNHGLDGWEVIGKHTQHSYLMKREIENDVDDSDILNKECPHGVKMLVDCEKCDADSKVESKGEK